ncbi:MAG: UDP-glucose/GDP-mannose dehydrogenase family protein [Chitinophagaceae bacterium]|nr:UDP-glucose/GDP-mannose dehydrogenase family protein [Chitinophagaceae bacterium]
MKIAVVGTGYVGLVSGTCFAETGNQVTCIDIDEEKVNKLQSGAITIYEPGLEKIFIRNIKEERLHFTSSLSEGIKDASLIFLALPTPTGEDGSADLKYILGVAKDLGKLLIAGDYKVIVDKSTVPVGTAEKVKAAIIKSGTDKLADTFDVVSNPEFLREGAAVDDFMKPDRVVIGTSSERAKKIMLQLYEPFVRQGNPIIFMDEKSAELTKYAANSFLAMKISFMNEIAVLSEKLGADVDMVRRGIGTDFRIGKHFLYPGLGYGGSCFPKDVRALAVSAKDAAYDFKILNAVMQINTLQKEYFSNKINQFFKGNLKGKRFAIWGLSFKPNTDDIRESPALGIIETLLAGGASVIAFDPEAMPNVKKESRLAIEFSEFQYTALSEADALIICTEWNEFRTPDFAKMALLLKSKVIFDGRNLYDTEQMKNKGFYYESIGRETIIP